MIVLLLGNLLDGWTQRLLIRSTMQTYSKEMKVFQSIQLKDWNEKWIYPLPSRKTFVGSRRKRSNRTVTTNQHKPSYSFNVSSSMIELLLLVPCTLGCSLFIGYTTKSNRNSHDDVDDGKGMPWRFFPMVSATIDDERRKNGTCNACASCFFHHGY